MQILSKIIPQAHAATNNIVNKALSPNLQNMTGGAGLAFYIGQLWKTVVIIGGMAFLIYLIWGGLTIMLAEADKGKYEEGQKKIRNALFGLVILVLSYAIVLLVQVVFKINLLSPTFPTAP